MRRPLLALLALAALSTAPADSFTLWPHRRHPPQDPAHEQSPDRERVTRTTRGYPGDALNVGLQGSLEEVLCAMAAAGWRPADPVTLRTSLHIAVSVLARRAYPTAPVSPLLYQGRRQDLAFQKPSGRSPSTRHHVRFWRLYDSGERGAPLWLGAATFDRSVGFSHRTGLITHHIGPDIDKERSLVVADLAASGRVAATFEIDGVGPTLLARNGGGDPYFTDGEIVVAKLRRGCLALGAPAKPGARATASEAPLFPSIGPWWLRFARDGR